MDTVSPHRSTMYSLPLEMFIQSMHICSEYWKLYDYIRDIMCTWSTRRLKNIGYRPPSFTTLQSSPAIPAQPDCRSHFNDSLSSQSRNRTRIKRRCPSHSGLEDLGNYSGQASVPAMPNDFTVKGGRRGVSYKITKI